MSISKRNSHIVYDKMVDKYYFILPDGSDMEIDKELLDKKDWSSFYFRLYRIMLKDNITDFSDYINKIKNVYKEEIWV